MTVRAFPQAGAVGGKVCCCILGIYLAFAGINDRFAVVFPLLDSGGADDAESVFLEEFCGASRAASTVASGDDLLGVRNLGEPGHWPGPSTVEPFFLAFQKAYEYW